MLKSLSQEFLRTHQSKADWIGVRFVNEKSTSFSIRDDKPEGHSTSSDEGVMVEVLIDGHLGYGATPDLSIAGLERAFEKAVAVTKVAAAHRMFKWDESVRPKAVGEFQTSTKQSLNAFSAKQLSEILSESCRAINVSEKLISRSAGSRTVETHSQYYSTNGSDVDQRLSMVFLNFSATSSDGRETQTRSHAASVHQQGAEAYNLKQLLANARLTGEQALELLTAENCPTGVMDLVALPDQMDLQIHESIGHPLELDRILGDERNYAGWSFVKLADFGHLKYGSPLMNVTFDPGVRGELASYAFDDGGHQAKREFLIKDGILERPLGGQESQKRSGLSGVANFRASSWNRAPIDRMANINLEPGDQSLDEMISGVERGVLMATNRSWSIDDYRNKFQFGCEYGKLIENGRLTKTVKNPNYRGVTTDFWNKLAGVGRSDTQVVSGTPYCGKGEPNQVIRVGHATPPCLFRNVEIFGGLS